MLCRPVWSLSCIFTLGARTDFAVVDFMLALVDVTGVFQEGSKAVLCDGRFNGCLDLL